jgi:hypothetical protein
MAGKRSAPRRGCELKKQESGNKKATTEVAAF